MTTTHALCIDAAIVLIRHASHDQIRALRRCRDTVTPAIRAADGALTDGNECVDAAIGLLRQPHSSAWHEALKACPHSWTALKLIGSRAPLEYRDCTCQSTLALPLAEAGALAGSIVVREMRAGE